MNDSDTSLLFLLLLLLMVFVYAKRTALPIRPLKREIKAVLVIISKRSTTGGSKSTDTVVVVIIIIIIIIIIRLRDSNGNKKPGRCGEDSCIFLQDASGFNVTIGVGVTVATVTVRRLLEVGGYKKRFMTADEIMSYG